METAGWCVPTGAVKSALPLAFLAARRSSEPWCMTSSGVHGRHSGQGVLPTGEHGLGRSNRLSPVQPVSSAVCEIQYTFTYLKKYQEASEIRKCIFSLRHQKHPKAANLGSASPCLSLLGSWLSSRLAVFDQIRLVKVSFPLLL